MEKGQRRSRLFSKDWFQELEKYEAGMLLVKMLMDMVTSSLHILSKLIIHLLFLRFQAIEGS